MVIQVVGGGSWFAVGFTAVHEGTEYRFQIQ
jgi:hypothetical protein